MPKVYGLRWVPAAIMRPHRCAMIPYVGGTSPKGFFDSGTDYRGDRVYVSVIAVEEMARALGFESPGQIRARETSLAAHNLKITQLTDDLAEANRELDAVEVLQSRRFEQRKPRGRKPIEEEVTSA